MSSHLHTRSILLTATVLCVAIACTKKPTVEECQLAADHVFELLEKEAMAQFKEKSAQIGAPTSDKADQAMAEISKNMRSTETWTRVRDGHVKACQRQPQTRANCVANAMTVDDLSRTCGMKVSSGPGGVKVDWPE